LFKEAAWVKGKTLGGARMDMYKLGRFGGLGIDIGTGGIV